MIKVCVLALQHQLIIIIFIMDTTAARMFFALTMPLIKVPQSSQAPTQSLLYSASFLLLDICCYINFLKLKITFSWSNTFKSDNSNKLLKLLKFYHQAPSSKDNNLTNKIKLRKQWILLYSKGDQVSANTHNYIVKKLLKTIKRGYKKISKMFKFMRLKLSNRKLFLFANIAVEV